MTTPPTPERCDTLALVVATKNNPTLPLMAEAPLPEAARNQPGGQTRARIERGLAFSNFLDDNELLNRRVDAITVARLLALAGLPKRRTKERDLVRLLRLGTNAFVKVTYSAAKGGQLPFGEDRFVIAAVQHLAIQSKSPVVLFRSVAEILHLFDRTANNQNYALLRERFKRIAGLSITLRLAPTLEALERNEESAGDQLFLFRRYHLPTKEAVRVTTEGQLELPTVIEDPDFPLSAAGRYGVVLDDSLWEHLCVPKNHLIVPLDLIRIFTDRPVGWDYLMFLVARCGAARSESVVDHDDLLSLFRDGTEPDRKVFHRLSKYHDEIMRATGGRLNCALIQIGTVAGGRGRPRVRWALRVGPSRPLVYSGGARKLLKAAPVP